MDLGAAVDKWVSENLHCEHQQRIDNKRHITTLKKSKYTGAAADLVWNISLLMTVRSRAARPGCPVGETDVDKCGIWAMRPNDNLLKKPRVHDHGTQIVKQKQSLLGLTAIHSEWFAFVGKKISHMSYLNGLG